MHTSLEYLEAQKIVYKAMSSMDYKSLLSAHNIKVTDEQLQDLIEYAAYKMLGSEFDSQADDKMFTKVIEYPRYFDAIIKEYGYDAMNKE